MILRSIQSTSSSRFASRDGLASTSRRYLKKYAHNEPGTYTSTEKAAPDAGLIFATSKSSCAKLLEQVKKVAFGSEHAHSPFPITEVAAGGASRGF